MTEPTATAITTDLATLATTGEDVTALYTEAATLLEAAETRQLFKKTCLLTRHELIGQPRTAASLSEYGAFHERVARLYPRLRKALIGSGMQAQGRLAMAIARIWARLGLQDQHCQFIAWMGETFNLFLPLTEPERQHLWAGQPYRWEVRPPSDLPRFLAELPSSSPAPVGPSPVAGSPIDLPDPTRHLAELGQRLDQLSATVATGTVTPEQAKALKAVSEELGGDLMALLQGFGLDGDEIADASAAMAQRNSLSRGVSTGTSSGASVGGSAMATPGTMARQQQLRAAKRAARARKRR